MGKKSCLDRHLAILKCEPYAVAPDGTGKDGSMDKVRGRVSCTLLVCNHPHACRRQARGTKMELPMFIQRLQVQWPAPVAMVH